MKLLLWPSSFWVVLVMADSPFWSTEAACSRVRTLKETTATTTDPTKPVNDGLANIINGNKTSAGEFPSFAYPDSAVCGASLIWNDVLVTAAHCLEGFGNNMLVHIGGTRQDGTNALESIPVDWTLPYPKYREDDLTYRYDIMLVFLQYRTTNRNSKPAQWNTNTAVPLEKTNLTIVGHGDTELGFQSLDLKKATASVVDANVCADAYQQPFPIFVDEQICVASRPTSACFGDSGGPLFNSNKVLMGITTGGSADCTDPNIPNRYTRVSTYKDWILEGLCLYSQQPPDNGECDRFKPRTPCNRPSQRCKFLGLFGGKRIRRTILGLRGRRSCIDRCHPFQSPDIMLNRGWQCGSCFDGIEDKPQVPDIDDDFIIITDDDA